MKMLIIEVKQEVAERLPREDYVVVGEYNAADRQEAVVLLKLRAQAMKDASSAYKKQMEEVERIDIKLQRLNEDEF